MVPEKFLSLTDLSKTQALSIHKLAEIIMIGKYKNFKFATL